MKKQQERTALLIGEAGLDILKYSRIAIFGIGGVGGYAAEALARAGIGTLDLVDKDIVDETNLNRQIIALHDTIGRNKVDVMAERIQNIDPEIVVHPIKMFYLPENAAEFDLSPYDYIIDAIDNITAKLELAVRAQKLQIPLINKVINGFLII